MAMLVLGRVNTIKNGGFFVQAAMLVDTGVYLGCIPFQFTSDLPGLLGQFCLKQIPRLPKKHKSHCWAD